MNEVPLRRAATVVLVRDRVGDDGIEALLLRRHSDLAFHGGAWVFPGGRIDDDDYGARPEDHADAARAAACREAREEAGLSLDADALVPFAHWTTPVGPPRRFATWFFVAAASAADEVATDGGEITDHRWFAPAAALAARAAGEIELPPPTFVSLTWLSSASSAADAVDAARTRRYWWFEPRLHRCEGGMVHLYDGDVAYDDISRLDADGPRHRLWTLAEEWHYEQS